MANKRNRKRISSKIDNLPDEIKDEVHALLSDTANTYVQISDHLKKKGFDISTSSVGRYAYRYGGVIARLQQAQEQTAALVAAIKKNPDIDFTEAANKIYMDNLVKKVALAEEEFESMDIVEAGKLIASLTRTEVYKGRVKQEMKKKTDLAFKQMEDEILKTIKSDPELAKELRNILEKAKEKMTDD